MNFPFPIPQSSVENCKVYTSRYNMTILVPQNSRFLEVGVAAGDFSHEFALKNNPISITLVDRFDNEDYMVLGEGKQHIPRFDKETNFDFVKTKFNAYNTELLKGNSEDILPSLPDKFYDFIYLDADSRLESFTKDFSEALRICSETGIIGINDYAITDYVHNQPFGTVFVVNNFLSENPDWEIIGFCIENTMFCDVYLRRKMV
jgi:hypothetical protein